MLRKRRQPAPNFRIPGSPFNPATGERAPLGAYPVRGTTLALFQVVGDDPQDPDTADTHDNYVVCRGYEADFDPNFRYLHDPYTKEDTTPINVAKPYSLRGTFGYTQGQVIVAARIKNRLGYNAAKATLPTIGQPEDLDDELELLLDDNDAGVAWMDISTSAAPTAWECVEVGAALGTTSVAPGDVVPLITSRRPEEHDGVKMWSMKGFEATLDATGIKTEMDGSWLCGFTGQIQLQTASPPIGSVVAVGFAVADGATIGSLTQVISQSLTEVEDDLTVVTNYFMLSITAPLNIKKDKYLQLYNASGTNTIKVFNGIMWMQYLGPISEVEV